MKKALVFIIFLLSVVIILITSSCEYFTLLSQKEWAELSGKEEDVIIYVSGVNGATPCYWKLSKDNQERIDLENATAASSAYSIFVLDKNVYSCGYYSPTTQNACYWINGKQYHLEMINTAVDYYTYSIKVISGMIFTVGYDSNGFSSF